MKKPETKERYIAIETETLEDLLKKINQQPDYRLVNYAVTSYWMHMMVKHEYTAILEIKRITALFA